MYDCIVIIRQITIEIDYTRLDNRCSLFVRSFTTRQRDRYQADDHDQAQKQGQ